MSPRDLTLEALGYTPNGNTATIASASSLQLSRIARDITAALQTIYSTAPAIYKRRDAQLTPAPQSVSVTVAQGSTALTCGTALVDGSTINIPGDPLMYNEVKLLPDGTKTLRAPFNGVGGTYQASVWGDSLPLDVTVDRVIGAVLANEQWPIEKRNNRDDAMTRIFPDPTDYGWRMRPLPARHVQGIPVAYWVEAVYYTDGTTANNKASLRMKLFPMPQQAYTIEYDVRVKPPRLVVSDLGTDGADSTMSLPIAADMIESILRPIFLKRWSASPWFRDKESRAAIADEAKEAMGLLLQYRPQQPSNRRIIPRF